MKDPGEELNKRTLQPLYLFLALECFRNEKQSVILRCDEIKEFFGLEVLRYERVTWIHQDSYDLFPFLYYIKIEGSSDLLALSRIKFCEENYGSLGDTRRRYAIIRSEETVIEEIKKSSIEVFSPYKGQSISNMIESLILQSAGLQKKQGEQEGAGQHI